MMSKWLMVMAAVFTLVSVSAPADIVFLDDFEGDALVDGGNPPDWTLFGTPMVDRGTYTAASHSPSASVWVAVNWDAGGWGWGAVSASNETVRYNLMDESGTLSVWMRATNDFTTASVALTLFDEDGTQWRTSDSELFTLTTTWTLYTTPLSNMVMETIGATAGLNCTNITQFGFLSYDNGQTGPNLVNFDDFQATNAIPEPATLAILVLGAGFLARRHKK